jgi:outer membrane PBP1 activator LpoA protein
LVFLTVSKKGHSLNWTKLWPVYYQLAIQNTVILADENAQLHIANNRQKRKRDKKRLFIATGAALTAAKTAKTIKLLEIVGNELEGEEKAEPSLLKKRIPSKYNICKSEKHIVQIYVQR